MPVVIMEAQAQAKPFLKDYSGSLHRLPFCLDTGIVEWAGRECSAMDELLGGWAETIAQGHLRGSGWNFKVSDEGSWWIGCSLVLGWGWESGTGGWCRQESQLMQQLWRFYQCLHPRPFVLTEMPHSFHPGTPEHLDKLFATVTDRFTRDSVILGWILPKREIWKFRNVKKKLGRKRSCYLRVGKNERVNAQPVWRKRTFKHV